MFAYLAAAVICQNPQDPRPSSPQPPRLPTVVVEGRGDSLIGTAASASEGTTSAEDLRLRPLLRPAEVVEAVPGIVITQHSGAGKSNQMFARGVNLDHGTDLATSLFGMPLNMPSHGHGQGYTDLNLLIPELIDTVRWRLGPYDVRDGDFASVGAVDIDYARSLPTALWKVTAGSFGHARTVLADSHRFGGGDLLYAVELHYTEGPFTVEQDYSKRNGFLSWSTDAFRLSLFGHEADWTATDQIPARAVNSGQIGRFDSLDPSDGGITSQYGGVAEWTPTYADGSARVLGFGFAYELELWSNFTFAQADPVNGDQFEQRDGRSVFGLEGSRTWARTLGGLQTELTLGAELRRDHIRNGLHDSTSRKRSSTVRRDAIDELSVAVFAENKLQWTPWLRTCLGARGDYYHFDVDSNLPVNSGQTDDSMLSTKAGVVFGPWMDTEFYGNFGTGFHSNDARGALTRDDPATATLGDAEPVPPLVRSRGFELGLRTSPIDELQTTLSLWQLDADSELLFVGDAGTTTPTRAARRYGIEVSNHWRPLPWLAFDGDVGLARARFRGDDPAGDHVPGSVPLTLAIGVAADWTSSLSTGLRLRHIGRRPLIEDGSVRAATTTLVNARVTWQLDHNREFSLDVLNLLDSRDNDIAYFYGSQLPGELQPVDDVHFHPLEPFAIQLSFTARF